MTQAVPPSKWRNGLLALLVVIAAVVPWWPNYRNYFLADDFFYVRLYSSMPLGAWMDVFTHEWSFGQWGYTVPEYRPAMALSYLIDAHLWGANPLGYHITNVVLHVVCSLLVGLVARRLFDLHRSAAVVAALLFALHPVHSEAVAWFGGRVDVLSTAPYLACFYFYGRYCQTSRAINYAAALVALAVAVLSKEMALTLPGLLLCYDILYLRTKPTRALKRITGPVLVLAAYYAARSRIIQSDGLGYEDILTRDTLDQFAIHQGRLFPDLFPPLGLLWEIPQRPIALFAMLILIATVVAARYERIPAWSSAGTRRGALFTLVAWYFITIIPLWATIPPSLRHLYLPSAGICIGIAMFLVRLGRGQLHVIGSIVTIALFAGILLFHNLRIAGEARLSGEAHDVIERLADSAGAGDAIVVSLPVKHIRESYFWWGAMPFAFLPPHSETGIYSRRIVIESPGNHFHWPTWLRDTWPRLDSLARNPSGNTYLVTLPPGSSGLKVSRLERDDARVLLRSLATAADSLRGESVYTTVMPAWDAIILSAAKPR